jgi:hypothetical protein
VVPVSDVEQAIRSAIKIDLLHLVGILFPRSWEYFLNFRSIRIFGMLVAVLREFYCRIPTCGVSYQLKIIIIKKVCRKMYVYKEFHNNILVGLLRCSSSVLLAIMCCAECLFCCFLWEWQLYCIESLQ